MTPADEFHHAVASNYLNIINNSLTSVNSLSSSSSSTSLNFTNTYGYLVQSIGNSTNGVSKSDLTSSLKSLLSNDTDDGSFNDEISMLTNIIADFDNYSKGGNTITSSSLASSSGYEA